MTVTLDGAAIQSEAQFHAALREASGVEWYGANNLDALFDLLVGVVDPPISITWTKAAQSRVAIGDRFARIVDVLFDAVDYRGADRISVRLES